MSDMLKAFGTTGSTGTGPVYGHPLSEDVVRECSALLGEIPEGQRLLKYAKDNDIKFNVMTGREPGFRHGDSHNLFLVCPANTHAVDLEEMACNLGLAIRDIEQSAIGIPHPNPAVHGQDLERVTFNHMLDIIVEMCKIAGEFADVKRSVKLVDLVEKLGHAELYRGFRSGKSQVELAEILSKTIKSV